MDRIPSIGLLIVATAALGLGQGAGRGPAAVQPPLGTTPKPAIPNAKPVRTCESLAMVALPNTTIESAKIDANNANVCRVTAITTHPPAGDKVRIWVAIPMSNWNGRFMGTGGGGFVGGSEAGVNQPLALGYAGGATDTGHAGGSGSFAMDANGHLDWQLVRDNAHVGIHEMTVTGKALTQALYNAAPKYSYFNGCSTGGRQGLMEAQRYPDDYNGIVSAAPAINWPKLMMQSVWSTAVMNAAKNPVPACKLQAATAAAIEACDAIDGVKDGVIENPAICNFDPKTLIGKPAGTCGTFTEADVDVIKKLLEGPRRADGTLIWHGQPWGADMTALAATRGNPLQPQAFTFAADWIRYWLLQNPQFDANSLTPELFEHFWDQSIEQYGIVIGTDNPDLSGVPRPRRQARVVARLGGSVDYDPRDDRLLQACVAADGRRGENRTVPASLPGSGDRPLRGWSWSDAFGAVGRPGVVGRRRQSSRNASRVTQIGTDAVRTSHTHPVPVSARA